MKIEHDLIFSLGADALPHINGTLAAHLRGTEALLLEWGARPTLCTAGRCHAIYGTDGYPAALASRALRGRIAEQIGGETEALIYLYGACDRQVYYPRIGTASQRRFADRYTEEEYPIAEQQLRDLCELILANELEIAGGSATFRAEHGASLAELFERMRGLVSEAGFRAYRGLLGSPRDGSLRNVSLRVPATTTTGEHMLQLRPNCECCDKDLPPESTEARICSFECTFCASCADTVLGGKCPNCGGEFVPRPRRPALALAKFPASSERVYKPKGCGKAA